MNKCCLLALLGTLAVMEAVAEIPTELDRLREAYKTAVARAVTPLRTTYRIELEKLRDSYKRTGNAAGVAQVDAELKAIGKEISRPVNADGRTTIREEDATVPANDPNGYRLSGLQKGDVITLAYVSGKWKNDGNIGSENPDVEGSSRGDAIRLVISTPTTSTKAGASLATVPAGTAGMPFQFVLPLDEAELVLRINEGSSKSPGKVIYHVKITR